MYEFFDTIYNWLTTGIYEFVSSAFTYLIAKVTILFYSLKVATLTFAWNIGKEVLNQLDLTTAINQAWGSLDSDTFSTLAFFRIPEALNIILAAFPGRLVLRMLGM